MTNLEKVRSRILELVSLEPDDLAEAVEKRTDGNITAAEVIEFLQRSRVTDDDSNMVDVIAAHACWDAMCELRGDAS